MCDDTRPNDELSEARQTIVQLTNQLRDTRAHVLRLQDLNQRALYADHAYPPKSRRSERIEVHTRQRTQITLLQAENTRMGTKLAQANNELAAAAARIQYLERRNPIDPEHTTARKDPSQP